MNKKFSTLVAAAMLATCVGTVSAEGVASKDSIPYVNGKYYVLAGGANGVAASADSVLSATKYKDGYILSLSSSRTSTLAEIDSALWMATITTKPGSSAPTFQFTNKATGQPLSINPAAALQKGVIATEVMDSLQIGGAVTEWKHSPVLGKPIRSTLSSSLDGDSSVVLGVTEKGHVIAYRAGNNEVNADPATALKYSALKIQAFAANSVYLNAADLNTMMWTKKGENDFKNGWFKLNYNPSLVGSVNDPNIFDQYLQAVPAIKTAVTDADYKGAVTGSDSVYLKVKDQKINKKQAFAMLDTAYFNLNTPTDTLGNKYRRFVYADTTDAVIRDAKNHNSLPQFAFKFQYYPTQDSIAIYTSSAAKRQIANDGSKYWSDANASISKIDTLVKIATLVSGKHSEFTVGSDLNAQGVASPNAAGVRFNFSRNASDLATIPSGYYFIKNLNDDSPVLSDKKKDYYFTIGLDSALTYLPDGNKNWMTASQWVVATNSSYSNVTNREFADPKGTASTGLFYKAADFSATNLVVTDMSGNKMKFEPVTDLTKSGYYTELEADGSVEKKAYALKYFTGFDAISAFVNIKADSALNVKESEKAGQFFELVRVKHNKADGKEKELENYTTVKDADGKLVNPLTRAIYQIKVKQSIGDLSTGDQYIVLDGNKYKISAETGGAKAKAAMFYLKKTTKEDFFALIDTTTISGKTIKDAASKIVVSDATSSVNDLEYISLSGRTSSFSLTEETQPLYRRLGVTDATDKFLPAQKPDTAKIFVVSNPNRFLNENSANRIAGAGKEEGLNYLGEFNVSQFPKSTAALFIDTAYVRNDTKRPQYLLGLRPKITHSKPCTENPSHPVTGEDAINAHYLVNLADSLATQPKATFETYTRLAFVPAKHIGDNFVVKNSKFYKAGKAAKADTISFAENKFNKAAFQFRLVKEGSADFKIESQKGEYVKILNGVPVLTTSIADAETFNIAKTAEKPVANEDNAINTVSVVATDGAVIINNAAGKTVMISNMLGQTIANTVLTSDNATIAVPAGIAVVAVEGEKAVKAVVR